MLASAARFEVGTNFPRLAGGEVIIGYNRALHPDHQAHRDAFRLVMICLMQNVNGSEGGAEA